MANPRQRLLRNSNSGIVVTTSPGVPGIEETSRALIDSVARQDLVDVAGDVLEHGLQVTIQAGILKDVPIIGALIKILDAGAHVRDALFSRKLFEFLWYVGRGVDAQQREEFVNQMYEDPATRKRVGERLILAIDRLDDFAKSRLLANAFAARLRGEIKLREFDALVTVIDRLMITYLDEYRQVYWLQNTYLEAFTDRTGQLQNCDLLSQVQKGGVPGTFSPTRLGELFFTKVVPVGIAEVRADFISSLVNMPSMEALTELRYTIVECDFTEVQELIARLTDSEFLHLKVLGPQINRENNEWVLRRIGQNRYQRFWEEPHTGQ